MANRRQNALVLLIVAGLVAASLVVIATKPTRLGLDLKGGVQLIYQGRATALAKVTPESIDRAIDIMRKRVDQLGVAQPEIQRTGSSEIDVALPDVTNEQRAQQQVGETAQLSFYDWEPNVIGPDGQPAPTEARVTGGQLAASAEAGIPEYEAVQRALKRPDDHSQERHHLRRRMHARAKGRLSSMASGTCSTPPIRRFCADPRTPRQTLPPTTKCRRA